MASIKLIATLPLIDVNKYIRLLEYESGNSETDYFTIIFNENNSLLFEEFLSICKKKGKCNFYYNTLINLGLCMEFNVVDKLEKNIFKLYHCGNDFKYVSGLEVAI